MPDAIVSAPLMPALWWFFDGLVHTWILNTIVIFFLRSVHHVYIVGRSGHLALCNRRVLALLDVDIIVHVVDVFGGVV